MLHDEADGVAAFAAPETFVNLLSRRYSKRWGFFVVEWAKSQVVCTSFLQPHKPANDINNINLAQYFLYGLLCDQERGMLSN